jgi:hypothetical protein
MLSFAGGVEEGVTKTVRQIATYKTTITTYSTDIDTDSLKLDFS